MCVYTQAAVTEKKGPWFWENKRDHVGGVEGGIRKGK